MFYSRHELFDDDSVVHLQLHMIFHTIHIQIDDDDPSPLDRFDTLETF